MLINLSKELLLIKGVFLKDIYFFEILKNIIPFSSVDKNISSYPDNNLS